VSGGSRWNDIAFLPIVADTEGRLHDDAARLLYQVASIKVSGWGPHPGRIIAWVTVVRLSSAAYKLTSASWSPPSARSSATTQLTS